MSSLRKCTDCKGLINLNTEDYFTEKSENRNIYRHRECGKKFLDCPKEILSQYEITLQVHFGANCPIKSFTTHGILVVNADFPASLETERIPVGEMLTRVNWSGITPEERKEIESKFIEAFGGGIAV